VIHIASKCIKSLVRKYNNSYFIRYNMYAVVICILLMKLTKKDTLECRAQKFEIEVLFFFVETGNSGSKKI
jgi:hypothetical protein